MNAKTKAPSAKKQSPAKSKKPLADSITRAAALMGIEPAVIRHAKAAGGDGFKGHRIDIEALAKWLKQNPKIAKQALAATARKSAASDLETRKLLASCELLEHRLATERGMVVPITDVTAEWQRLWAIVESEAKGLMDPEVFPIFMARVKAKIK